MSVLVSVPGRSSVVPVPTACSPEGISGRRCTAQLAISSTPTDAPLGPTDVWVETPHPTYHELDVVWSLNGEVVEGTDNRRDLDLEALGAEAGDTVSVRVSDPTDFVRDPEIIDGPTMSATRAWTVGSEVTPPADVEVAFTTSTQTDEPVGREDVVYVETTHPTDRVLDVAGNISTPEAYTATVLPGPAECDTTITGTRRGILRVTSGVVCLVGRCRPTTLAPSS